MGRWYRGGVLSSNVQPVLGDRPGTNLHGTALAAFASGHEGLHSIEKASDLIRIDRLKRGERVSSLWHPGFRLAGGNRGKRTLSGSQAGSYKIGLPSKVARSLELSKPF